MKVHGLMIEAWPLAEYGLSSQNKKLLTLRQEVSQNPIGVCIWANAFTFDEQGQHLNKETKFNAKGVNKLTKYNIHDQIV